MGFDYAVMEAVQSLYHLGGAFMDFIFTFFTFLGEETFLLIAIFAVYWCINKHFGELLLLSLYSSIGINGVLKDFVRRPRPFLTQGFEKMRYVVIDNGLVNTAHLGESFSFPSGHSQCAGAFFGAIAFWKRSTKTTLFCIFAILAVMASRVYLGVHFPTDVLMGAVIGIVMAAVSSYLFRRFYAYKLWLFAGAVLLSSLGLLAEPTASTIKTIGVGIGAFIGLIWESRFQFTVEGSTGRRLLRLVIGVAILAVLRGGLKILLPQALFFDGLRYAIVGFFATGVWPWAFTRYKL